MSDAARERDPVRVAPARCPYCHDAIPLGEEPGVCPGCHALHHKPCLKEHRACATCGAAHPRFTVAMPPRPARPGPATAGAYRAAVVALAFTIAVGLVCGFTPANDQVFGLLVAIAATLAIGFNMRATAVSGPRARLALSTFALVLGALIALVPSLDAHVRSDHLEASLAWGAALALAGLAGQVLGLVERARERAEAAREPRPDAASKGGDP